MVIMTDCKETINVVVIGGTGVGKTWLCNILNNNSVFKFATPQNLKINNMIIDTPAFDRCKITVKVLTEIKDALQSSEQVKLILMICLNAGRLHIQDAYDFNNISKLIQSEFTYGILVNKASKSLMTEHSEEITSFLKKCFSPAPLWIKLIPFHFDSFEDINNEINYEVPFEIRKIINDTISNSPPCKIILKD